MVLLKNNKFKNFNISNVFWYVTYWKYLLKSVLKVVYFNLIILMLINFIVDSLLGLRTITEKAPAPMC